MSIPTGYMGNKTCTYKTDSYDADDAKDNAAYSLFKQLDLDNNGELEVKPELDGFSVEVAEVTDVPSLWGPSLFEVKTWD